MKSDRIEARVDTERAERIRQAALISDMSMSSFIVSAAAEKADRVIDDSRRTTVPDPFFDSLLEALDEVTKVPALARAATRARRSIKMR